MCTGAELILTAKSALWQVSLAAMARIALRLPHKTPAWASWLPHWLTCTCAISREEISTRPTTALFRWPFQIGSAVLEKGLHHVPPTTITQKFTFGLAGKSAESLLGGGFYNKLRASHRGTFLGPFVCGALKKRARWWHATTPQTRKKRGA
jgi:hypothetical protein